MRAALLDILLMPARIVTATGGRAVLWSTCPTDRLRATRAVAGMVGSWLHRGCGCASVHPLTKNDTTRIGHCQYKMYRSGQKKARS
jgi:hypothetical protein